MIGKDTESPAAIARIRSAIEALERSDSGRDEHRFLERRDFADEVEVVLDHIEQLVSRFPSGGTDGPRAELEALLMRARRSRALVDGIDERWFARLREEIATGHLRGMAFRDLLSRYSPAEEVGDPTRPSGSPAGCEKPNRVADTDHEDSTLVGYDALDDLVNGLLLPGPLPAEPFALAPGMVGYQQTPVRVILRLVDRARFVASDVFFDFGSGSGRVSMLVNLLAGVAASGIEIDPALARHANERAIDLDLRGVRFTAGDARAADLSGATVFFLYAPFRGTVLTSVLERLRARAGTGKIRVFAWGPGVFRLRAEHWLEETRDDPGGPALGIAGFTSR
jgi:hypothetical protein